MRANAIFALTYVCVAVGVVGSDYSYELKVVNAGRHELSKVPVAISLAKLPARFRQTALHVSTPEDPLVHQVEDLDGDGSSDQLLFLIDLPSHTGRKVKINRAREGESEERRISGEQLAWRLWSEPYLESRPLRIKLPPSRPRGLRSIAFPPDTPMPYAASDLFRVIERKDEKRLFKFTLQSERPVMLERARQRVASGPVRSIVRRTRQVSPQSNPEADFRIEERFSLYEASRRLDIEIAIINVGESDYDVPANLRILDGVMGNPLVKKLGRVAQHQHRHSKLWLNEATGHAMAYIPHAADNSGWNSETIGVDYFRFAPSPGPKLRLQGVNGALGPGKTRRVRFTFMFYRGEPSKVLGQFRRDVDAVPGVVSVHGKKGKMLRIAKAPGYIVNGVASADRWVDKQGATIRSAVNGCVITSRKPDSTVYTGFARDFRQPSELRGQLAAKEGVALEVLIEPSDTGKRYSVGRVTGSFRLDLNSALPLDGFHRGLLHLKPVAAGGEEARRDGELSLRLSNLTLGWPMPKPPKLPWPKNGQKLSSVGVSFSVKSMEGYERGYELQVADNEQLNDPIIETRFESDTGLKGEGGLTKYLPEELLEKGTYYWRVRPLNWSDQAGEWTSAKHFVIDSEERARREPVRPISPESPVLFGGLKGETSRQAFAEEVKRKYPAIADLVIEQRGYEPGGDYPLPFFAHTSGKPTLPMLEYAFRNEPKVLGMVFREYGFDKAYLRRVLALAAKYGRYVSALNLGKGIGQRSFLTESFYPLVNEYGDYLLPQRKMNNRRDQLGHLLTEIGAYVSGRVGNWGIESEWGYAWKTMGWRRWTRVEAVNRPLNYMPTFVFGLSTGASFYRLEGWAKRQTPYPFDRDMPDKFGPLWTRAIAPFFQDIVKYDLIPSLETIRKKIKVAIAGKKKYGLKRPGSPGTFFPNRVAAAIHGVPIEGVPRQHVLENQWIPDSSACYVVPVLPAYMPAKDKGYFEKILDPDRFDYPEDAARDARQHYPPEKSEAYAVRVGDTAVALNSIDERRDPRSGPQRVHLDLTKGPVAKVTGTLDYQAYLLMKQMEDSLFIHANNFEVNYTDLTLHARNGERLRVEVTPENALRSQSWDGEKGELELRVNHYKGVTRITTTE